MPIASSSIIVCGQRYDVGRRVITFADDPTVSAYTLHRTDKPNEIYPFGPAKGRANTVYRFRQRRLMGGERSLSRLKQIVRQFVIHHDGCNSSRQCFDVLHNERGLSVHFLIDNDGTIFQTLDLVECAFQAAGVNEISIGAELANRGDAQRFPNEYHGRRDKVTCRIQGHQFLAYAYTNEQLVSMAALGTALARIFPNLPQVFPVGGDGDQLWSAIPNPRAYTGYLGHYHVSTNKWDPGPFDFKRFTSKIRSRTFFPLALHGDKYELPETDAQAEDLAADYYDNNEAEGEGGYFPVGPLGESKLWHGGIHLRADKGTPLYAPFGGKIVAARFMDDSPTGSRNFVLIRHDLGTAKGPIRFWTLLMHLDNETGGASAPRWFNQVASQFRDDPIGLNVEVTAGELVGHVGEAGPPGRFEGQVHLEIMSADEIGARLDPGFWHVVEDGSAGRFCDIPEIVGVLDRGGPSGVKDGKISRLELVNFFRQDDRRVDFRKLAIHHLSEWTDQNDWLVALSHSDDFAALAPAQRQRLFRDQIEPVLWWNDDIELAAELPASKLVWNYHPITFIVWLNNQLHATAASAQIKGASDFSGTAPPPEIKDDADATEGFTDDEDVVFGDNGKKLELQDLVNGYPDEK